MDATRTLPFDAPEEITEMSFVEQTLELSSDHGTLVWASRPDGSHAEPARRPLAEGSSSPSVGEVTRIEREDPSDCWADLELEHTAPLDGRPNLHTSAIPTALDGSGSSDLQDLVADAAAAELRSRRPRRRATIA